MFIVFIPSFLKLKLKSFSILLIIFLSISIFGCKSNNKDKFFIRDEYVKDSTKIVKVSTKIDTGKLIAFAEGKYPDEKWGYTKNGRVYVAPQFAYAGSFNDGLAKVQSNSRWGFIDDNAQLIIKPVFEGASDFHGDKAIIYKDENFYFINRRGEIISGIFDKANQNLIPVPIAYKYLADTSDEVKTPVEKFVERAIGIIDHYKVDINPEGDGNSYHTAVVDILKHSAILTGESWFEYSEYTLRVPSLNRSQAIAFTKLMVSGNEYNYFSHDIRSEYSDNYPGEDILALKNDPMKGLYRIRERDGVFEIVYSYHNSR